MKTEFDVVICGGGLAGLTLARQLKRREPALTIAVVEKTARPLPAACHKVGESTVDVGTHYYAEVLGLKNYLEKAHLRKLGLRYFFGDSQGELWERPELGPKVFPAVPNYQLDRGVLENDLRRFVSEDGVVLFEGCQLSDIVLAEGDEPHRVLCKKTGGANLALTCRWVVDASGRRRFLQDKLGLKLANGHNAGAVWFRMAGRLDVADLVPKAKKEWHERVPGRNRWFSTVHLMGRGYWVWLIPLSSGNTSVGIVADEALHPFKERSSFALASAWLKKHEPKLAAYLAGHKPLDFLGLKNYSYHSRQVFSRRRWACVGEAGIFSDPFYSPGSDFIGMSNSITVELILRERRGELADGLVEYYNSLYLGIGSATADIYRNSYPLWGTTQVMAAKIIWDNAFYWAFTGQFFIQNLIAMPEHGRSLQEIGKKYYLLNLRVQQLFRDWAARTRPRSDFSYFDDLEDCPILMRLFKDLRAKKTPERTLKDMAENIALFEEWAQVLFFQALEETAPGKAEKFSRKPWVNAWAVGLESEHWEKEGLFEPVSKPRSLARVRQALRLLFPKFVMMSA